MVLAQTRRKLRNWVVPEAIERASNPQPHIAKFFVPHDVHLLMLLMPHHHQRPHLNPPHTPTFCCKILHVTPRPLVDGLDATPPPNSASPKPTIKSSS